MFITNNNYIVGITVFFNKTEGNTAADYAADYPQTMPQTTRRLPADYAADYATDSAQTVPQPMPGEPPSPGPKQAPHFAAIVSLARSTHQNTSVIARCGIISASLQSVCPFLVIVKKPARAWFCQCDHDVL